MPQNPTKQYRSVEKQLKKLIAEIDQYTFPEDMHPYILELKSTQLEQIKSLCEVWLTEPYDAVMFKWGLKSILSTWFDFNQSSALSFMLKFAKILNTNCRELGMTMGTMPTARFNFPSIPQYMPADAEPNPLGSEYGNKVSGWLYERLHRGKKCWQYESPQKDGKRFCRLVNAAQVEKMQHLIREIKPAKYIIKTVFGRHF